MSNGRQTMIKSMTGFASLTYDAAEATIGVTVRSVNHRYLDVQIRVPPRLADLEPRLRGLVQGHVARGRVELAVSLQPKRPPLVEVELNEQFVTALASALDRARDRGLIGGDLTAGDLLRFPQAVAVRERAGEEDPAALEALSSAIETAATQALADLDAMRTREGGYLRQDLDARRGALAKALRQIAGAADQGRAAFENRLALRVSELKLDLQLDPAALSQEIVRLVARADISEEVVRFDGHLQHWIALADAPEPCGRKLDFLLQEMHREINTIGAKADGMSVTDLIVAAKAELEKMREQVQNVE